jgi:hypothetical protein
LVGDTRCLPSVNIEDVVKRAGRLTVMVSWMQVRRCLTLATLSVLVSIDLTCELTDASKQLFLFVGHGQPRAPVMAMLEGSFAI